MQDKSYEVFIDHRFLNSPWLTSKLDWSFLKPYGTPIKFRKNQFVNSSMQPSACVYYIAKGRVRTSVLTEDGEEKIIFVADQGNIIDEISVIDGLPNYLITTAVTESLLYRIDRDIFLKLINSDIEISNKVVADLACKLRIMITQIEDLSFMSSSARIAKCLYRLSREYGIPSHNNKIKLNIKFTHQEMAIYAGTCRVTASNILGNMEKDGIIRREKGYVIIEDLDRLKKHIDIVKPNNHKI